MHYDAQLVLETEGNPAYLKTSLDAIASVLPHTQRVEFTGCGHLAPDNSDDPERIAQELRSFFAS